MKRQGLYCGVRKIGLALTYIYVDEVSYDSVRANSWIGLFQKSTTPAVHDRLAGNLKKPRNEV